MTLEGKVACVFAAGGAIGVAVAHRFARQGAAVYLSRRHRATVDPVATTIKRHGGSSHANEVDALDPDAVESYLDAVAGEDGGVDVVFNAIGVHPPKGCTTPRSRFRADGMPETRTIHETVARGTFDRAAIPPRQPAPARRPPTRGAGPSRWVRRMVRTEVAETVAGVRTSTTPHPASPG